MAMPSPMELMVIAVIALLVLGPKRLPEAARSLGQGIREMKAALAGEDEDERRERLEPYPDDEPDEER